MDLRTWQEAGSRAGSYSARHRARNPFSPLRPAPMAIGSLSTAAIAAFAFAAPGILHSGPAGVTSTVLDGAPNRMAPMAPGNGGDAAPGFVSVTAPPNPSSDSPAAPTSTATSAAMATSSSPASLTVHTPTPSAPSSRPSQPAPTQTQPPPSSSPTPTTTPTGQPPTAPPTKPWAPVVPPTTPATPASFNSTAAVSSALTEIGSARKQQGVSLLNMNSILTTAAKSHSQDMARTGKFSHIGSDGSDPFSRAANLGCFSLSQELIAHGRPGDDVIGALMKDPASRRALLSFWNSTIGVSAQLDPATGDVYWTIELGWV